MRKVVAFTSATVLGAIATATFSLSAIVGTSFMG
jgi:hypothetical protein